MTNFLNKFQPIDIIALITISGGLVLRGFGIDGLVGTILTMIVVFYFGKKEVVDRIRERKLPEAKAEKVEQIVRRVAIAEGIDPDLALRVAGCESGFNPAVQHLNSDGSVDRGLYQINSKWHPEITAAVAFDAEKATQFFCDAFKAGHLSWWNASKKCWDL